MISKKIISLLCAAVLTVCLAIPLSANAAVPENLLLGIIPTTSTTDQWLLTNRPPSNLTNGSGTTLTDESNANASPCSLSNVSGKSYSWCRLDFSATVKLNKVIIQEKMEMSHSKDIAIDVLLSSGGWKRVGLKYNIADTYRAISFTFSPVSVLAVRFTFGSARTGKGGTDISEIEGYYDDTITKYDELQSPDNPEYEIEEAFADMNLFRGIKAITSNSDEWFKNNRPVENLTDGSGTVFSVGWQAEYGAVCSVTSVDNTGLAWIMLELPQIKPINKIIIQQIKASKDIIQTKDFAVDVLCENHKWKRVASSYNTDFTYSGFYLTFEPVKARTVRITGVTEALNLKEVEAYCDSDITEFDGVDSSKEIVNEIQAALYGDLNYDYRFNTVDMVVLKRQLLGSCEFPFVDQNEDGVLNILDLIRMKKNLISGGIEDDGKPHGSFAEENDAAAIEKMVNDDYGAAGNIYYVDAINGNDKNDGLSESRAILSLNAVNRLSLKPGDRVLFKRGCVWNGELIIKNSGTKQNPIIIGMYGEGSKPMLNGCGEVMSTVLLSDVSYVTVRNLDLTNYRSSVSDFRTCISAVSRKKTVQGIKIQNNYVHSVKGLFDCPSGSANFYTFGAISVKSEKSAVWNGEDINFQDIIIENNRVERVSGNGITAYGGVRNLSVKNNIVNNVRGDGIILAQCFDSAAEYNVVYSSGWGGSGRPHVNIWCYNAKNTVLQYNESYDCQSTAGDGQGFDIDDACTDCTVQYNYSHDNIGGFFIGCAYYNEYYGNVVRYNISQNDKRQLLFLTCPSKETLNYDPEKLMYDIYNNTFYTSNPIDQVIYNDLYEPGYTGYGKIRNNIFYVAGSPYAGWGESDAAFTFSNNCYYGIDSTGITDKAKITSNPMLLAAGTAKEGRATCGGYQLTCASPCLSAGVKIAGSGKCDFWNNAINGENLPNIGAYGGDGVERTKDMNLAAGRIAKSSFGNESDTFVLNNLTDERVSSSLASAGKAENGEEWVEISFDEPIPLGCVWLTAANDPIYFPIKYKIEVLTDGEWKTAADSTGRKRPRGNETLIFNFSEITVQKFRITATALAEKNGSYCFELAEISAFSVPMTID